MNSNEPVKDGEIGRIVITDLFNKAFPMIRYDTGDLGIMESRKDDFPVFVEIFGKKMDCCYSTKGDIISPHKLEILMWNVAGIRQWQFVQDSQYTYHFNINGDYNEDYSCIIESFKGILGEDAKINIQFVDEIPSLSSNKRRMVICNYNHEN